MKLELVTENNSFLNHFSYTRVFGFTFLALVIPVFFILPFLKNNSWFFTYFYFILSLWLISFLLMKIRYRFKYDYQSIGTVSVERDKIKIDSPDMHEQIPCSSMTLIVYYNAIRGKGFHFLNKDFARSGISELIIGNHHFKVLISNKQQMNLLQKTLVYWHQNQYMVSEFTRTPEKNTLHGLELIK